MFTMSEEKDYVKRKKRLNDGYKYIKEGSELLATSGQREKQGSTNYEVNDLVLVKRQNKNIDIIQRCIGQLSTSYDGNDSYRYGTGTLYKHLKGKYYLILTCAHNLVYYNDETNCVEKAK
eukprot:5131_1